MNEKLDSDFLKLMIERYNLGDLLSEYCETVEVIECEELYQCSLRYQENEKQRKKILQCSK